MTYIMSCVWLDYMVKYFQCKNCVGSSLKTKKCVASFLVPGDSRKPRHAIRVRGFLFAYIMESFFIPVRHRSHSFYGKCRRMNGFLFF